MLQFELKYAPLTFKRPSGTSRGILTQKHAWYIYLSETGSELVGIGEISIIEGLTKEFEQLDTFQNWLEQCVNELNENQLTTDNFNPFIEKWYDKPSLYFGLETAFLDFSTGGKQLFYDTAFTRKEIGIPINGLIWLGSETYMNEQIQTKLHEGYSCIKMKIGAIDFDTEIGLLSNIRKHYTSQQMTLRVDANGAFSYHEALEKLQRLAALDIHSIEQPIRAGNWDLMAKLCRQTPCPIALDEELIGVYDYATKKELLGTIRPQYIILKPSLHGGLKGCREWIDLATSLNIPWWITSALESNVGLNMIAQFVSTYDVARAHQGLGTGGLFVKNTVAKTEIRGGELWVV